MGSFMCVLPRSSEPQAFRPTALTEKHSCFLSFVASFRHVGNELPTLPGYDLHERQKIHKLCRKTSISRGQ